MSRQTHFRYQDPIDSLVQLLVLVGIFLTPFWFITLFGVNLGPADLLMIICGCILVIKYRYYTLFPSKLAGFGIYLFLFSISISTIVNPSMGSFLQYIQYMFIFLIFFPVVYRFSINDSKRAKAILILTWTTGLISIIAVLNIAPELIRSVLEGEYFQPNTVKHLELWYGNWNQLYWVIACGSLLNLGAMFDRDYPVPVRLAGGLISILGMCITIYSSVYSAVLLLSAGVWIFTLYKIIRMGNVYLLFAFMTASGVIATVGGIYLWQNWEYVYSVGNLDARLSQYSQALDIGLANQPFGVGLENPGHDIGGVHNFAFSLWVEAGILALIGYVVFLVDTIRTSIVAIFQNDLKQSEISVYSIIFGFLILILVQPEPVRRFWYVIIAFGYAIVGDQGSLNPNQ
jgi:hypothetical protein